MRPSFKIYLSRDIRFSTSVIAFRYGKYDGMVVSTVSLNHNVQCFVATRTENKYKVSIRESIVGVSWRDVVVNPLIFLLTCRRLKHSFYMFLK